MQLISGHYCFRQFSPILYFDIFEMLDIFERQVLRYSPFIFTAAIAEHFAITPIDYADGHRFDIAATLAAIFASAAA